MGRCKLRPTNNTLAQPALTALARRTLLGGSRRRCCRAADLRLPLHKSWLLRPAERTLLPLGLGQRKVGRLLVPPAAKPRLRRRQLRCNLGHAPWVGRRRRPRLLLPLAAGLPSRRRRQLPGHGPGRLLSVFLDELLEGHLPRPALAAKRRRLLPWLGAAIGLQVQLASQRVQKLPLGLKQLRAGGARTGEGGLSAGSSGGAGGRRWHSRRSRRAEVR